MSASFSITIAGKGTFTAAISDPEASVTVGTNTPASFSAEVAPVGPKGDTGAVGPPGVVAATAPITYNAGTQTVGISANPTFTSVSATTLNTTTLNLTTATFADATSQTTAFVGEAFREYLIARNANGTTIPKGSVVYLNGAVGNHPTISLAIASDESTSSRTIGITAEAIANNAQGKIIISGRIDNMDTSAYTAGDVLYLSSSVPGGLQTTLPIQPLHGVVIGIVTRANPSVGTIEIFIQNYQELKELSDVAVSDRVNNDGLFWEASSNTWRGKSIGEVLGYTPANGSDYLAKASNLSDLASASTARTNLGLGTMAVETASNYLTTASAASTYQTLAGMTGYATESFVTSQGYLTAPYNPFDQSLNTTNGVTFASLQIVDGDGSNGFVYINAGALNYITVTDYTLTGTNISPDGITFKDSTTQSTAGLSPADAATTYAPISSPVLTGNPQAPTPTLGDNDTSIATTAFVNAYAPAATTSTAGKVQLATTAEAFNITDATKAVTSEGVAYAFPLSQLKSWKVADVSGYNWGITTNGGHTGLNATNYKNLNHGSITTVGWSQMTCNNFIRIGVGAVPGIDWTKPSAFSFSIVRGSASTANQIFRAQLGKTQAGGTVGDLPNRGYGIRFTGTGVLEVVAHNGTSFTAVASSYTPTTIGFCCRVESDGLGNVLCYVDDNLVGTNTNGPSTAGVAFLYNLMLEVQNIATSASSSQHSFNNIKIYLS